MNQALDYLDRQGGGSTHEPQHYSNRREDGREGRNFTAFRGAGVRVG